MLRPDYPIVTARLRLRPLTLDDVDAVHAYQSRGDVCRYLPYFPRSREEVIGFVRRSGSTLEDEGQALLLGAQLPGSGIIGDLMLAWRSREHRLGDLGYVFSPQFTGRGYATEAAAALLELAFAGLGLHRIIARLDARNEASARVARRLGMRQEAHLVENEWFKGEWTSELDFAVLDREWESRG